MVDLHLWSSVPRCSWPGRERRGRRAHQGCFAGSRWTEADGRRCGRGGIFWRCLGSSSGAGFARGRVVRRRRVNAKIIGRSGRRRNTGHRARAEASMATAVAACEGRREVAGFGETRHEAPESPFIGVRGSRWHGAHVKDGGAAYGWWQLRLGEGWAWGWAASGCAALVG